MHREAFRGSPSPTLGVEIELQIVDAEAMDLQPAIDRLLADLPESIRDSVKPEFHQSCVEINSDIADTVAHATNDLSQKFQALSTVAARLGLDLAWAGTHPFSRWQDQPISAGARYEKLAAEFRETICRQLTFGLHVHVGVPDGESAIRAFDHIRAHIPALLALSANSPLWCGRSTGLLAHRPEIIAVGPTSGLPPRLGTWERYLSIVRRLTDARCISSPKELWWDVRPSPTLGTIEVRVCDMPSDFDRLAALTSLIQCLVVESARLPLGLNTLEDDAQTVILQQNRWRAARHGLEAEVIHPTGGPNQTVRSWLREILVRLRGIAHELHCDDELAVARSLVEQPTAAERQLAIYQSTGDLRAVVRSLLSGDRHTPTTATSHSVQSATPSVPSQNPQLTPAQHL